MVVVVCWLGISGYVGVMGLFCLWWLVVVVCSGCFVVVLVVGG